MSSPDRVSPDLRRLHAEARHLTGQAAFAADIEETSGTLHLAVGRAPVSAGRITRLDLDDTRRSAGVVAVAGWK